MWDNRDWRAGVFLPESRVEFRKKPGLPKVLNDLNDLEFAYTPVRDKVRDLREYL